MILNNVKLQRATNFDKCLTSKISLSFVPMSLSSNRMVLVSSNLLDVLNMVINEVWKNTSENFEKLSFLHLIHYFFR